MEEVQIELSHRYLYSVDPQSARLFLSECQRSGVQVLGQLDEQAFLVQAKWDFRPLFARHRFRLVGQSKITDLENGSFPLMALPERGTLAIQLRADRRLPVGFRELSNRWWAELDVAPERRDDREPEYVVSGFLKTLADGWELSYGISPVEDNLSPWSGGVCRIPVASDAISRAEQKLLEALELVGPFAQTEAYALDLGAAPGGWTRVAAGLGFQVHAVDPAEIHERLLADPAITHFKTTSGRFLETATQQYDLLLCDMKMDPVLAARTVLDCHPGLSPSALLVMTLKLPKGDKALVQAHRALEKLSLSFDLLHARQLYFNRHEITVLARKKPETPALREF